MLEASGFFSFVRLSPSALNAHGCQWCRLKRCIEAGMDVSCEFSSLLANFFLQPFLLPTCPRT